MQDKRYPFVIVDAMVIKIREEGRLRPSGLMTAMGINTDGYREVLGIMLGDSESEASWSVFFGWLKRCGLSNVDLIVSDHHSGLVSAIRQHFQGLTWQRCQTHFIRNILDAAPKSLQPEILASIRATLNAPDAKTAKLLLNKTLAAYETKAPKAMAIFIESGIERLNEEIRRRERVIRIFPNRASALRLIGALLMEIDDKWACGKNTWIWPNIGIGVNARLMQLTIKLLKSVKCSVSN